MLKYYLMVFLKNKKIKYKKYYTVMNIKPFLYILLAVILSGCVNEENGEIINVKLSPSLIVMDQGSDELMRSKGVVSDTNKTIYAVQIYENNDPYYYGLFDDISKMEIALTTTKTYKFKILAFKSDIGPGLKTESNVDGISYFLPNKTLLENKFIKGDLLENIDLASSLILNGQQKDFPETDVFYCNKSIAIETGTTNIDFSLKRMGFGITFNVDAFTSGSIEILLGNDTILLNSQKSTASTVRLFNRINGDFNSIYNDAEIYADSIPIKVKWTGTNGTVLNIENKFLFHRNYKKTINIQLNTNAALLDFEDWASSEYLGVGLPNVKTDNSSNVLKNSIPINQWSYIAIIKNSAGQCQLYINGQFLLSGNYSSISYSWYKLILGGSLYGGRYSNYLNGAIDEVRISNNTRTSAEILNYYNSNKPFSTDANTIGLWHFDQESGTSISSEKGPIGILTNGEWVAGKFGNSIEYNGISSHADFTITMPTTNLSIEFWIKPYLISTSWPVCTYGYNTSGVILSSRTTD